MALSNINYGAGQDSMEEVFDKTNAAIIAASNISFSGALATIVVQIGDWDLNTNASVNVLHGLGDYKKIRAINFIIREDSDLGYYSSGYVNSAGGGDLGVSNITSTYVQLTRLDSGSFDNTNFDSTSYNRGWITITYEV